MEAEVEGGGGGEPTSAAASLKFENAGQAKGEKEGGRRACSNITIGSYLAGPPSLAFCRKSREETEKKMRFRQVHVAQSDIQPSGLPKKGMRPSQASFEFPNFFFVSTARGEKDIFPYPSKTYLRDSPYR